MHGVSGATRSRYTWTGSECTGGDVGPGPTNFVCEECDVPLIGGKVSFRACPNCSVMEEKTSGCNLITCRCNAHWCCACGEL